MLSSLAVASAPTSAASVGAILNGLPPTITVYESRSASLRIMSIAADVSCRKRSQLAEMPMRFMPVLLRR